MKTLLVNCVFALLSTLCLASTALATDLTIDTIFSPRGVEVKGKPTPVSFRVKNINVLRADAYSVHVQIFKVGVSAAVYQQTVNGSNLLPFTDTTMVLADWTPSDSGSYSVTAIVSFAEDINNANNTATKAVKVLAPPEVTITIQQVVYFEPRRDSNTKWGYATIRIPPTTTVKFVNVLVRRSDSDPGEWIIRNIMILPSDRLNEVPLNAWMDLARLGLLPKQYLDSVNACIYVTDTPMTVKPAPNELCDWIHVTPDYYYVGKAGALDSLISLAPEVIDSVELPHFTPTLPVVTDSVERGCSMTNIELDSLAHNSTNTPGYAGDKNACGPTAAANSLDWMERADPRIHTGLTDRQKLVELSQLMQRLPEGGVYREKFIAGKLAFIDKYKLPIRVKFMSWKTDTADIASPNPNYDHRAHNMNKAVDKKARQPKWEWLVQELKDSEDVEMEVGFYDSTGRTGGHWVTVTGTHTVLGKHRLRFKDDSRQTQPGGTRMDIFTWDTSSGGWNYLNEWSAGHDMTWIESLVSESYDPTMTFISKGVNERYHKPFGLRVTYPAKCGAIFSAENWLPGTKLSVVNIQAQVVRELKVEAGTRAVEWDGNLWDGGAASPGIYFVVAESGLSIESEKFVLR